jgi:NAD(P)-dependent dehydrogenase (short-subunit alcohol dehydrogenase family)
VNNAGFGMSGFFEDLSEEDIRSQMETNFFGAQNVTRTMIPLMRPRRRGKIINISSISGQVAYPCFSAYNASKWAMEAWSEALYYELKLFGINVSLIEPGSYPMNIFYGNARFASRFDDPASPYYEISQYFKKRVRDNVDKNRRDPIEIARLVERLILSNDPPFRNVPDWHCSFILF